MDLKSFLSRFWQLASVLRVAGVQALGATCVSYVSAQLAVIYGVRGCPPAAGFVNYFLWVFGIAGVGATIVGLYYIFFPAIWLQKIDRQLLFSNSDLNVPFYSTRPVYVLIDAVMFIPAIALVLGGRVETMCRFNFWWVFGWSFLFMTFLFPVARTVSWYVFRRRIEAKHVGIPWPTLFMWGILTVPAALFGSAYYTKTWVYPRLRAPVVDEQTFIGGLANHPEFTTRVVRVQGTLVREIEECGLSAKQAKKMPYPVATVLLDIGAENGQIMVKANTAEEVELLSIEATGRKGEVLEAYGRLSKLPNLQKRDVCGLKKVKTAQPGGLALLEIELP